MISTSSMPPSTSSAVLVRRTEVISAKVQQAPSPLISDDEPIDRAAFKVDTSPYGELF
jgi:hypothetical protein